MSAETLTLSGAIIFTGLVVVFVALIGLSLIVWLFGKLFTALQTSRKPPETKQEAPKPAAPGPAAKPAPQQAAVQAPAPAVEDGIGDEIVAVIAAAIAAMSGENGGGFTLRSVRRVKEARPAWAQAGLAQNTQPF